MKIEDLDAVIIGYINDKGVKNNFDIILAGIIELNIKGHLSIIYKEEKMDSYNYKIVQNINYSEHNLNKFEMLLLSFLFSNKMEITKIELEEKLKNTFQSYNIQYNEINKVLKEECINQELMNQDGTLTLKGKEIKERIENYKQNLENKEFLVNKNKMDVIVKDKEFANSIVLHIKTDAKDAFVDNEVMKYALNVAKISALKIAVFAIIVSIMMLLFARITLQFSKFLTVFTYIVIAIVIAASADVVYLLNNKNKK